MGETLMIRTVQVALASSTTVEAMTVPNFSASMPPGFDKAATIIGWVAGAVAAVLLVMWLIGIGRVARAAHRGEQSEATGHMGVILVCALALGATSAIFAAL